MRSIPCIFHYLSLYHSVHTSILPMVLMWLYCILHILISHSTKQFTSPRFTHLFLQQPTGIASIISSVSSCVISITVNTDKLYWNIGQESNKYSWQYFNSLWLNDTIWWHWSWSTLAQVVAYCLTAPSHCLNQCWLIKSVRSSDVHLRVVSQKYFAISNQL